MARKQGNNEQEKLKRTLKAQGLYSPVFDTLILSCAQLAELRNKAYEELEQNSLLIEEISREGELRKRINPAFSAFIDTQKELRSTLIEMQMTVKSANITSSDELDELTQKIEALKHADDRQKRTKRAKK